MIDDRLIDPKYNDFKIGVYDTETHTFKCVSCCCIRRAYKFGHLLHNQTEVYTHRQECKECNLLICGECQRDVCKFCAYKIKQELLLKPGVLIVKGKKN